MKVAGVNVPKYSKKEGYLALVQWYDARGISSGATQLLAKQSPDQMMKGFVKITVGFVSVDKDTLVIAEEIEVEDGKAEIHDLTLVPKAWIKSIKLLVEVK